MNWSENRREVVLLVEDDAGDQELIRRGLEERCEFFELIILSDGDAAFHYLKMAGSGSEPEVYPPPSLIIVDLNLSKCDGREIIQFVRRQKGLKLTPIVVLTTSSMESDVCECYELGCNTFISKPDGVADFMDTIQQVGDYWLNIASVPFTCGAMNSHVSPN